MKVSKGSGEIDLPSHRSLLVGDVEVPCRADVIRSADSGLEIKTGHGARRRVHEIDFLVLHWTGGEGDAFRIFDTLQHGRDVQLGAEWMIDQDGTIFECCDPLAVDTFDAGRWNPRSVGVEVTNYGYRRDQAAIPARGRIRRRYVTRWNGQRRTYASFLADQTSAIVALCDAVCGGLGLPRRIPREADGSFAARTLNPGELATFHGVLGHCHLTAKKSDPGTEIFDVLDAAGYE